MFSVAFAFVLATALAFAFKNTRWMGVVAAFVLLAIAPLFFTGLMLIAGAGYYLFTKRSTGTGGKPSPARGNERGSVSRDLLPALGAVGLGAALIVISLDLPVGIRPDHPIGRARAASGGDVIVIRTPGGLLEVAQLKTVEVIDARVTHTLLGIAVGELVPRIRVPAFYRYHVELAPEWRALRTDGVFTLVVPPIRPSLPVAVDFAGIERDVSGTWLLQPLKGTEDLRSLERGLTETLAAKAASRDYLERQRETARKTVSEFARKWIREQAPLWWLRPGDVRVLFADEQVGALGRPAG